MPNSWAHGSSRGREQMYVQVTCLKEKLFLIFKPVFFLRWSCAKWAQAFVFWLFSSSVWCGSGKAVVAFGSFLQSSKKSAAGSLLHMWDFSFLFHTMSPCKTNTLPFLSWLCPAKLPCKISVTDYFLSSHRVFFSEVEDRKSVFVLILLLARILSEGWLQSWSFLCLMGPAYSDLAMSRLWAFSLWHLVLSLSRFASYVKRVYSASRNVSLGSWNLRKCALKCLQGTS